MRRLLSSLSVATLLQKVRLSRRGQKYAQRGSLWRMKPFSVRISPTASLTDEATFDLFNRLTYWF